MLRSVDSSSRPVPRWRPGPRNASSGAALAALTPPLVSRLGAAGAASPRRHRPRALHGRLPPCGEALTLRAAPPSGVRQARMLTYLTPALFLVWEPVCRRLQGCLLQLGSQGTSMLPYRHSPPSTVQREDCGLACKVCDDSVGAHAGHGRSRWHGPGTMGFPRVAAPARAVVLVRFTP